MKPRIIGLLFAAMLVFDFSLTAQTPVIPDTPAGHTMRAWMDAFNSGDRARIQDYLSKYEPTKPLDGQVEFRNQTGGFDVVSIDKSERLSIEFVVKERNTRNGDTGPVATSAVGKITVKEVANDAELAAVVTFSLRGIPQGMTAADMNMKIDAAERARVIEGAVASLNEFYIFPETARKMEDAVISKLKSGGYDSVTGGNDFADMLTTDFRAVSHDKHLRVGYSIRPIPKRDPSAKPDPAVIGRMRAQAESNNCSFEKVEWLPSNIGYLKFNGFLDPDVCGPTVTAAMNFLAHTDALIIDLRENGGGDPDMVAYICTYLFAERTHLNDLYNRKEDKTTEFWTLKDLPGPRLAKQPVFVLTSKRTFSGGEEFTYDLKNLKRATIIGETTGGGAHPVSGHRIDDHFTIGVPFARAINPISKTNWEGTGVEPDVKAPAGEALDVAKKMALEQIRKPKQ